MSVAILVLINLNKIVNMRYSSIKQQMKVNPTISSLINIISGIIIMILCSQITIPLQPVPITLQTVGVVLIGLLMKPQDAVISMLAYLAIGATGLPVFADYSGGFLKLTGTTGGYLWGFVPAVMVIALIQQANVGNSILIMAIGTLLGSGITLLFGVLWLSTFIGFTAAINFGLLPFIIPGAIKALFTAIAIKYIKQRKV